MSGDHMWHKRVNSQHAANNKQQLIAWYSNTYLCGGHGLVVRVRVSPCISPSTRRGQLITATDTAAAGSVVRRRGDGGGVSGAARGGGGIGPSALGGGVVLRRIPVEGAARWLWLTPPNNNNKVLYNNNTLKIYN